jgi:hypothetical protein
MKTLILIVKILLTLVWCTVAILPFMVCSILLYLLVNRA